MLVIIPQAKEMDMHPVSFIGDISLPLFQQEAEFIAGLVKSLSLDELARKMNLSKEESLKIYDEYQVFDLLSVPAKPAVFAFADQFYKTVKPLLLTPADLHYSQQHLRIVSPLYGLLRPLDQVKPYRLTFDLSLSELGADSIHDYWKDIIVQQLHKDADSCGNNILFLGRIDGVSLEEVTILSDRNTIVIIEFKDRRDDEWKDLLIYSDEAKAQLLNHIIKGKVNSLDNLKSWSWKGYCFDETLSTRMNWIFSRTIQADE